MDMDLITMVETYHMFSDFEIHVPKEDYEKVDSLQFAFNNMLESVSLHVQYLSLVG